MAKKAKKETDDMGTIVLVAHKATIDFADEAADKVGVSRAEYVRQSIEACAESDLKRKAPAVPVITRGRRDEITDAAKAKGLTRTQYLRELGLAAHAKQA